jgi:DNA-binding response OmpR family regulator
VNDASESRSLRAVAYARLEGAARRFQTVILVVEDDDDVAVTYARLFGDLGCVVVARNGVEAVAKAKTRRPDLVITDSCGYPQAQQLAALAPLLAVSGHDARSAPRWVSCALEKPVDPGELRREVRRLLGRSNP